MNHIRARLGLINSWTLESKSSHKAVAESYQKALGALVIKFSLLTYLLESFSREMFALSEPLASCSMIFLFLV
jgi:hypothetical protein